MKTVILCCFTLLSVTLSYLFEKSPTAPSHYTAADFAPESGFTDGSDIIFSLAANYDTEADDEEKSTTLTAQDSIRYNRYARTLGLKLDYTEDQALLETVSQWIGTPYRYGNNTKKGTDCSGFVVRVYQKVYGVNLKRSSHSMFGEVQRIKKEQMQPGDLVFFRRSPKSPIYHVGIYLRNNRFVHSATNGGVMVNSLLEPYYKKNFYAAGRVEARQEI